MSKRATNDLISAWLAYTQNSESPTSYHLWGAIASIAGTLQRRAWMQWGHTTIYPNQYIILVGPSGRARKGEPILVARKFLSSAGIQLISEDITREGLIKRLHNSVTNYQPPGSNIRFQCSVSCISEELAVFLGEGDTKFLATLTNWYDSRDKWAYETKGGGIEEIEGVCLNMFGSMAEDWIPLCIPHKAIGGGFTSRIIFVVAKDKGQIVPNPNDVRIDPSLEATIEGELERIHAISGEYVFSQEALETYMDWYTKEEEKIKAGHPAIRDPRFQGYVSRRATHLKKISMSMAASRSSSLVITQGDFERALALVEETEKTMADAFGKIGKSFHNEQTKDVMDLIKARKKMTRSELLRALYQDVDRRTLELIEATLSSMRVIKVETDKGSGEVLYTWIG